MLKFSNNASRVSSVKLCTLSNPLVLQEDQSKSIYSNFIQGKYDHLIFNENPQLTEELKLLISKYNRDFIQRLFTKCSSRKTLNFWLREGGVKLPKDTWALAVNLGNNIIVLQHLKETGWFENLSKKDKDDLLTRAQKFKGAGLEYLKVEFAIIVSKPNL